MIKHNTNKQQQQQQKQQKKTNDNNKIVNNITSTSQHLSTFRPSTCQQQIPSPSPATSTNISQSSNREQQQTINNSDNIKTNNNYHSKRLSTNEQQPDNKKQPPTSSRRSFLFRTTSNKQASGGGDNNLTINTSDNRGRSRQLVAESIKPEQSSRSSSLSVTNRIKSPNTGLTRFKFSSGKHWRKVGSTTSTNSISSINSTKSAVLGLSITQQKNHDDLDTPFSGSTDTLTIATAAAETRNKLSQLLVTANDNSDEADNSDDNNDGKKQPETIKTTLDKKPVVGKISQSLTTSQQQQQQQHSNNNNNNEVPNGNIDQEVSKPASDNNRRLLSSSSASSSSTTSSTTTSSSATNSRPNSNNNNNNNNTNLSSSPPTSRSSSASAVTPGIDPHSDVNPSSVVITSSQSATTTTTNKPQQQQQQRAVVSMPPPQPAMPLKHQSHHRRNASSSSSTSQTNVLFDNNQNREKGKLNKRQSSVDNTVSQLRQSTTTAIKPPPGNYFEKKVKPSSQIKAKIQSSKANQDKENIIIDHSSRQADDADQEEEEEASATSMDDDDDVDGDTDDNEDVQTSEDEENIEGGENGPKMGLVTGIFFKVWSLVKVAKSRRHRNQRASEPDTASNFEYIAGDQASQQYPLASNNNNNIIPGHHGSQLTISSSNINANAIIDHANNRELPYISSSQNNMRNSSSSSSSFYHNTHNNNNQSMTSDNSDDMKNYQNYTKQKMMMNNSNQNKKNNTRKCLVKKSATTTLNGHELANSHMRMIPQTAINHIPGGLGGGGGAMAPPRPTTTTTTTTTTNMLNQQQQQQQELSISNLYSIPLDSQQTISTGLMSRPVVVTDQAAKLYPITKSFSTNNFFSYQQQQQQQLPMSSRMTQNRQQQLKPIIVSNNNNHKQHFNNATQHTIQEPVTTTATNLLPMLTHHHAHQQNHRPTTTTSGGGSGGSAGSRSVLSTQSSLSTGGDTSSISSSASANNDNNAHHLAMDNANSSISFNQQQQQHHHHHQMVQPLQIKSGIHYHAPQHNKVLVNVNQQQQQPVISGYYGQQISRPTSLMLPIAPYNDMNNWCMTPTGQLQYQYQAAPITPGAPPMMGPFNGELAMGQAYPIVFSPNQFCVGPTATTATEQNHPYIMTPPSPLPLSYHQQQQQHQVYHETFNRRSPKGLRHQIIEDPTIWVPYNNHHHHHHLINSDGQQSMMANRRQFPSSSMMIPPLGTHNNNNRNHQQAKANKFKMSTSVSMNSFQTRPSSSSSSVQRNQHVGPMALLKNQQQQCQQKNQKNLIEYHDKSDHDKTKQSHHNQDRILNELILKNQSYFRDPFLESIRPLIPIEQPPAISMASSISPPTTITTRRNIYMDDQVDDQTTFKPIRFYVDSPIDDNSKIIIIENEQQQLVNINSLNMRNNEENININNNNLNKMQLNTKRQQENLKSAQCHLALESENALMLKFKRRPRLSRKLYKLIKSLARFEYIKANTIEDNNNKQKLSTTNTNQQQQQQQQLLTSAGQQYNKTLHHVVISGPTGSGKTLFVRHLIEISKQFQLQLKQQQQHLNIINQDNNNLLANQLNLFNLHPTQLHNLTTSQLHQQCQTSSSSSSSLTDEYQIIKAENILSSQLLAYHYCQAHDYATKNTADFIQNLLHQIVSHNSLSAYQELLLGNLDDQVVRHCDDQVNYRQLLSRASCLQDPVKALKEGLIEPLNNLWDQGKITIPRPGMPLLIVIDALEEACRLGACPNHPQPFDGPTRIDTGSCQSSACSDDDTFTTPPINQPVIDEAKKQLTTDILVNNNQQVLPAAMFLKCDNPIGKLLADIVGLFPCWIKFIITINSSHLCYRNYFSVDDKIYNNTSLSNENNHNQIVWKHLSLDVISGQHRTHQDANVATTDQFRDVDHPSSTDEMSLIFHRDLDLLAYIQTRTRLWSPSLFERLTTQIKQDDDKTANTETIVDADDADLQDGCNNEGLVAAKQRISPRRRAITILINYLAAYSHGSFFYCDLLLDMIESKKISFEYSGDNNPPTPTPTTSSKIVMRLDKQFAQSISRSGWDYLFKQQQQQQQTIMAKNQPYVSKTNQQSTLMKQLDLPNELELDQLFYLYMEFKFPQIRSKWFSDQATVIMQILMAAICSCTSTNLNQINLFMVLNAGHLSSSSQTNTTLETNSNGQNTKKSISSIHHDMVKCWKAFEATLNELSCAHLIKLHKASSGGEGDCDQYSDSNQDSHLNNIEHITDNLCFMFKHDSLRQWLSNCHPTFSTATSEYSDNSVSINNGRSLIDSHNNNNHRFNIDATYGHYCLAKWLLLPHHDQMEQPQAISLDNKKKGAGDDKDDEGAKQLFQDMDPSLISLLIRKRQSVYDSNNHSNLQRFLNPLKCLQIASHAVHCFASSCRRRRSSSTTSFNWALQNGITTTTNNGTTNQNKSIDSGISNMATNTINSSVASQFKDQATLDQPLASPTLFSPTTTTTESSQSGIFFNDDPFSAHLQSRRRSSTNQLIPLLPAGNSSTSGITNLDPLASPWFDELLGILCDQDETLLSGALTLWINFFDPQLEASRLLLSAGANANITVPVGILSPFERENQEQYPLILMMTEKNDLEFVKLLLQFQADPDPCILSPNLDHERNHQRRQNTSHKEDQNQNQKSNSTKSLANHLLISNPSLIAAHKGYTEILKLLVEHGASDGITPRYMKILKATHVDDKLFKYYHPLLVATCFNHKEIVEYLIDHLYYVYCVSINSGHQEDLFLDLIHKAIVIACLRGHHQIYEVLVRFLRFCLKQSKNLNHIKTIINKCDFELIGHTPLTAATCGNNLDICLSLIKDLGAQITTVNTVNQTPLSCFLATMHPVDCKKLVNESEVLEIVHLLMKGTRVDSDDESQEPSILKSLLDDQDKPFGFTALIHASRVLTTNDYMNNRSNQRAASIRGSISTSTGDSSSDDATSSNERLSFASSGANLEDNLSSRIVKIMIKYKANVNLTDIQGSTALMHAIQCDNLKSVQYLIDSEQIDINIRNELDMSAVDYACLHGRRANMLKMLIDNGANFEYKDNNGLRLLDRVIDNYSIDSHDDKMVLIEYLLQNGAKLGSKTWDAANGKMTILDVLLRKLCQDGYYLYKKMQIDAAVYRFEYALKRLAFIEHSQAPFSRMMNERNFRMDYPHHMDHHNQNQLYDEAIVESMQQTKYQLYLGLSRCERKRKNYMKALEDAHMTILIESSSYEGYFSKAQILKDLGEYHDALVAIEQALNLIDKKIAEIMNELSQNVPVYGHNNPPRSICETQMTENAEYLIQARKYVHNLKSEIINAKHISSNVMAVPRDKTTISH